jgi:hypothetical protein
VAGVAGAEDPRSELARGDNPTSAGPCWALMACKNSSLGTPRGRYDEHSSKSSLSCETKVESNQ